MLNGVNLNYIVVLLVTGAVLIVAIYHTILFSHRRTKLLARYSIYLWSTFAYCLFRAIFFFPNEDAYRYFNPDETLQMISFVMYIRFAGIAMDLDKRKDRYASFFVERTPYIVGVYLVFNAVLVNSSTDSSLTYFVAKMIVRAYLLLIGFLMVVIVVPKRKSVFYRYLAAGAVSMILCGLVSSLLNILVNERFILGAISWLMFGFFSDAIFFSAAIGYRIRQEHNERENSLKELIAKEAELQQKELEKMRVVYETREEERLRIARDLHDDMGSTLSSIGIYSKVVGSYIETDKKKANEFLEKIQYNSKQLMETTTDLIWSLQTNYGQAESVYSRIQKTAIEMLSSANITPHIRISPAKELPLLSIQAQKNCWLIFKEAVNNVCKYSRADNCHVSICRNDDKLIMSISDDGAGFENPEKGNGLKNMRQRADELGGKFAIESSVGAGTKVEISFCLDRLSLMH
jgi:signal transduction histidine kinase